MLGFNLRIIDDGDALWLDPASTSPPAPSRLNDDPEHPRHVLLYTAPRSIELHAIVAGVDAPLDSDPVMQGRTFRGVFAEYAGSAEPTYGSPPGQSSVWAVTLVAGDAGHHLFRLAWRGVDGAGNPFDFGTLAIPFDVTT